jgi:branched-chain amino acid aminotransferase
MIKSDIAWLNGKLIPFAETKVHITTHTLHYGLAAFEGIRAYKRDDGRGAVFRLREHIERLLESSKIATMDVAYSQEQLEAACAETMRANKLVEAYLRPLVYVGAGVLGLGATSNPVEVAIIAFPWAPLLGEDGIRNGIRAHVSTYVRGHLNHTLSKGKISGQYVNSVVAKREAQRLGYDEGIMLDADGRVCEGTGENIFIVHKGRLITPPLDLPILAGITRDAVMTLASEVGHPVTEAAFTRDMLYTASEVFMTGTASEVTPVREIDARPIGDGRPGPITRKLQAAFYAAARGPGEPHPEWLSYL